MDYSSFIKSKFVRIGNSGFDACASDINPKLYPWQREIVAWAIRKGRAALFCNCGLGKSPMQLQWAKHVHEHTGENVLIVAPLAVNKQTVREGVKFDVEVNACRTQDDVKPGVNITNYEMVHHFSPELFSGVVLDESGILKAFMGKMRRQLTSMFAATPFRLACTATPAPNDHTELGNHSEFLGYYTLQEMQSRWFKNDGFDAGKYVLKGYAEEDFWKWCASWSVCIQSPADLGYPDAGYDLPALHVVPHIVSVDECAFDKGLLVDTASLNIKTLHDELRKSAPARAQTVADIVFSNWKDCEDKGCLGKKNTPTEEERNITQAQKSVKDEKPKGEPQKKTRNTCENTTKGTRSNLNSQTNSEMKGTGDEENDTQKTNNTEKNIRLKLGQETPWPEETQDLKKTSGSPTTNTKESLNLKVGVVPSAEAPSIPTQERQETESIFCTSTIAMQPDASVASCALPVIWESENLTILLNYFEWLQSTSKRLDPWLIWCHTNYEQDSLKAVFGNKLAFYVSGDLSKEEKESRITNWINGERPIMISKPSIMGWGLNIQFCNHMATVSPSYSFESRYQSIRRCWRYGQEREVFDHIVMTRREASIFNVAQAKEDRHNAMADAIKKVGHDLTVTTRRELVEYNPENKIKLPQFLRKRAA